ncbi:MAG: hypothetical protein ACREIM_07225 [Nitrospiraceae bacterium]
MESSNVGSSSISEGSKRESRQDFDEPPHDEAGADFLGTESFVRVDGPDDACIGGIHQLLGGHQDFHGHRPSHTDGDFSDLMTGVVKDAEVFVRRYPWPTMLIGFTVGYLLSRSREK